MSASDASEPDLRVAFELSISFIMPFPMLLVDSHGMIAALSRSASTLFGFENDEAIAKNVGLLLPQLFRDIRGARIAEYAGPPDGTQPAHGRVQIGCHRNGQEIPFEILVGETWIGGERLFVCLIKPIDSAFPNDASITARPDALSLTELVATTSNLVHELNQPLTAMNNFLAAAQIALVANAAPDQIADFVADASAQSLRARTIVRRLREILTN